MADLKYEPVPHNHAEFLASARKRKGFSEEYDSLQLSTRLLGKCSKLALRRA